jgi:hypothetical protein
MSVIATLVGYRGATFSYNLADLAVPPMYITRGSKLYAVQPWEMPPGAAAIEATYRRIHCLDVTELDCTVRQPDQQEQAA